VRAGKKEGGLGGERAACVCLFFVLTYILRKQYRRKTKFNLIFNRSWQYLQLTAVWCIHVTVAHAGSWQATTATAVDRIRSTIFHATINQSTEGDTGAHVVQVGVPRQK
jgi:hypothetical protein